MGVFLKDNDWNITLNPEKPVKMFFSEKKGIFAIKSINLIPSQVKQHGAFKKRITKLEGDNYLFTCFDVYLKDSIPVEIDFNNPNNEDFVKAYYRWKLLRYFRKPQLIIFNFYQIKYGF